MKKDYFKPAMNVVVMKQKSHILAGSVNAVSSINAGDTGITYGGGSTGSARASELDFDEDWE